MSIDIEAEAEANTLEVVGGEAGLRRGKTLTKEKVNEEALFESRFVNADVYKVLVNRAIVCHYLRVCESEICGP